MDIIEMPQDLLRASKITWTMDSNHGYLSSPFSGAGQVQRGQLERWVVSFDLLPVSLNDSGDAEAFFLALEGRANPFSFFDPSRAKPKGSIKGEVTLARDHTRGDSRLDLKGVESNLAGALKTGDWLQVGLQLVKVARLASSDNEGRLAVTVWPRLWTDHSEGVKVAYNKPRGVFRLLSDLTAWTVTAGQSRQCKYTLSGVQEIIL